MNDTYFFALPTIFLLVGIVFYYLELLEYFIKDNLRGKGETHYHYGFIPFINPYAVAGVLLYLLVRDYGPLNMYILFGISFIGSGMIEVLTGVLAEKILKKKLWDYSHIPFNILGYTTPFHMIKWSILSILSVTFFFPFFIPLIQNNRSLFQIIDIVAIVLFFLVIIFSIKKPLYSVKFK